MTYNRVIELKKAINGLGFLVERVKSEKEFIQFADIVADLMDDIAAMPDGIAKKHSREMIQHYQKRARMKLDRIYV